VAVHYATSTRAGGDYYDFFEFQDGSLGIVLADASGHGTPAAVVMAMLRALLHNAPKPTPDPAMILSALDRSLTGNLPASQFATACWITLEPGSGRIRFSNAGHCPPLVLRADGTVEELDGGGSPPLGIATQCPRTADARRLEAGEMLVLYTDGLTEAMDARNRMFGDAGLKEAFTRVAGRTSLEQAVSSILKAVQTYQAKQEDDLTLLLLRRAE
jgi:sigma-B regulation protein RsbU (phosphoserine phosphatase)